jgi:hypothetical protein
MADVSGPLGSRRVPVGKGEVWRDAAKLVSVYSERVREQHVPPSLQRPSHRGDKYMPFGGYTNLGYGLFFYLERWHSGLMQRPRRIGGQGNE